MRRTGHVIALWLAFARPVAAQSLRRFEEPRKPQPQTNVEPSSSGAPTSSRSPSGSPSRSQSNSKTGDGCGTFCSAGITVFFEALFSRSRVGANGPGNTGKRVDSEAVLAQPVILDRTATFPSTSAYDHKREAQVFMRPWHERQEPVTGARWLYSDTEKRHAEIALSLFAPLRAPVFAADLSIRAHLKYVVLAASWERFVEPRARGRLDSLDLVRVRAGGNVLGGRSSHIELYPLLGAMYFRGPTLTTGAFDVGIEARAYPVYPVALLGSFAILVFGRGQPLVDSRIEAGLALGPFDLRLGLRYLKQEPAESYLGPTLTLVTRL
jgi:hypothetical protein